jgi:transposase
VPAPDDGAWCRPCGGADLSRHRQRAGPLPKAVGAAFGLTPSRYQSGEINRTRAISRCGDEMMRMIMLVRTAKWSWLKAWAIKIAGTAG